MKRKLFTLASALSLLLCVATAVAGVRSYWRKATIAVSRGSFDFEKEKWRYSMFGVVVNRGESYFMYDRVCAVDSPTDTYLANTVSRPRLYFRSDPAGSVRFVGQPAPAVLSVGYRRWDRPLQTDWIHGAATQTTRVAALPVGAFAVISLLLPTAWVRARLRGRQTCGRCGACGYDLRATPDRCLECGTPVVQKDVAAKHGS